MKIVQVASELFPLVKTGGLADAVSGLGRALAHRGHDVAWFLPAHRDVRDSHLYRRAERLHALPVELGGVTRTGRLLHARIDAREEVFFIEKDEFFDRSCPYGCGDEDYDDNDLRFTFFSAAVVQALRLTAHKADIVHAHDWQCGLVPVLLRHEERRTKATLAIRTVFTVHNIAYQGLFPRRSFDLTGLPRELWHVDGVEFYGQLSMLKAGLQFADRLTTVSPTFADEIRTPRLGSGLDGVLRSRGADFIGLVNGIDDAVWNPATDPYLESNFSAAAPAGRAACRRALLEAAGWRNAGDVPIFLWIGRLTELKGVARLLAALPWFARQEARLLIVGRGSRLWTERITAAAEELGDRVAVRFDASETLVHHAYAGADFLIVPSTSEPCGLVQLYALAYGTIPIVSPVGGLRDTVIDVATDPDRGTGLHFADGEGPLEPGLDRALALRADPARFQAVQARALAADFSWRVAAAGYEQVYQDDI